MTSFARARCGPRRCNRYGTVILPVRTAVTNAHWEGEIDTSSESDPAFAQLEIVARELKTYVDISARLSEDSAVDLSAEISDALAKDFGKKEGTAFVNGTGANQPRGILVHPSVDYFAGGDASNLTAAGLIGLFHAVLCCSSSTHRRCDMLAVLSRIDGVDAETTAGNDGIFDQDGKRWCSGHRAGKDGEAERIIASNMIQLPTIAVLDVDTAGAIAIL